MNVQYPYISQLAFLEVKVPVINLGIFLDCCFCCIWFGFLFGLHVMYFEQDYVIRRLKATEH